MEEYFSWNDYFMSVAVLSSYRSKDITKVGCCIVNEDKRIIGIGYNGLPKGFIDSNFDWTKREGNFCETKYPYIIHAEQNAILNVVNNNQLKNASMFSSLFACNECAKLIVQSGIKTFYYLSDKYHDKDFSVASRKIFDVGGVKYIKFIPTIKEIIIKLDEK